MSLLDDIVNSDATPEPVIIVQVSGGDTVFGAVIVEQPTENPILVELLQEAPAISGFSGFSGVGLRGLQGLSGYSGIGSSGYSGFSGSGLSGYSGLGLSGYSGYSGMDGTFAGSGFSGYSGFSAASPGESGYSGYSGTSGFSGPGASGYSGFSGVGGGKGNLTFGLKRIFGVQTGKMSGYWTCPYAGTISAWNLTVDAGTITVEIWKIAAGTAHPTSANSINTAGISLSSNTNIHSTDLTDFIDTTVNIGDIFAVNILTVSGVFDFGGSVEITKT